MPELPEVETIRRGLTETCAGRRITAIEVGHPDPLRPSAAAFVAGVSGRAVTAVGRLGKHLLLTLDNGLVVLAHLKMTGQLRLVDPAEPWLPHTHLELALDDGRCLRWRDVRRFGWLELTAVDRLADHPALRGLGPDALAVSAAEFRARLRGRRQRLKPLLLSQECVAGLGNIYADETLWRARLHPLLPADRLGPRRADRLHLAMQEILTAAVAARGSSIDGEYVALDGFRGEYQLQHRVYGRAGQPAPCCGQPVRRIIVAGRSTHYCPACQRLR